MEDTTLTVPYLGATGIGVSDLARSTDFYTRVLGLRPGDGAPGQNPDGIDLLAAGVGVARPTRPGDALVVALPAVATRPLSAYAIGDRS